VLSASFAPCVLIPCYNHGAMLASVLARLAPFNLPVIVVDDGSDARTKQHIAALDAPQLRVLTLPHNQGKGAAVIAGLRAAAAAGFSHALQLDADGQHQVEDTPRMLAEAERYPHCLIRPAAVRCLNPEIPALWTLHHPFLGMGGNAVVLAERQHVRFPRLSAGSVA